MFWKRVMVATIMAARITHRRSWYPHLKFAISNVHRISSYTYRRRIEPAPIFVLKSVFAVCWICSLPTYGASFYLRKKYRLNEFIAFLVEINWASAYKALFGQRKCERNEIFSNLRHWFEREIARVVKRHVFCGFFLIKQFYYINDRTLLKPFCSYTLLY